jgi:putative hemolysin
MSHDVVGFSRQALKPLLGAGVMSLGMICAAGLIPLAAQAQAVSETAVSYCKSTGGKVETYRFYDGSGHEFAKPAHVCNYPDASGSDPFGHALVDLATLYAAKPTLAALAYYAKPAWDGKFNATPAKDYCLQLGAAPAFHGSWSLKPGGGQSGMCMFEDGSFMEEWTLFYNQAGTPRGVDLTTVLRFKPNLR